MQTGIPFDLKARQVDGARILVRLHSDETDESAPAALLDVPRHRGDRDARDHFIAHRQADVDVRPQHLPRRRGLRDAV
jgi:hypothetical protein